VTSNVEGPDGTPPSAREGTKAAHERWKRLLTIVPIVIGLVLLVLLIIAVVTSQSTT
jgi:DMSO/TMAO reductase YedYZ heme-binding membrane subunit